MPTIVVFPTIVKDAVHVFGDLFANDSERRHFAGYLTGLIIAEKKTVSSVSSRRTDTRKRVRDDGPREAL